MPEFLIHMLDGKIQNIDAARRFFAHLSDGVHQVKTVSKEGRSLDQNAYFHAVVVPAVFEGLRDMGFDEVLTPDHAKSLMKNLFAKSWINKSDGSLSYEYIKDTHLMTRLEFSEFMDKIFRWAAEYLGIAIPLPNEYIKNYDNT